MRSLFCCFVLYLWVGFSFAQNKLIFAVDVIRHGDRTPTNAIPRDPFVWPQGLSELTAKGMHQVYLLGLKNVKNTFMFIAYFQNIILLQVCASVHLITIVP